MGLVYPWMAMSSLFRILCMLALLFGTAFAATEIPYTVSFEGSLDNAVLRSIKNISDLYFLRKTPPQSLQALQLRINRDIPRITQALHAFGFFEGEVQISTKNTQNLIKVVANIIPGPQYTIGSFNISVPDSTEPPFFSGEDLGIFQGAPALSSDLSCVEIRALEQLASYGYPLAQVESFDILVDGATKQAHPTLVVCLGPPALFGCLTIVGNQTVKTEYIQKFVLWEKNTPYNNCSIDQTKSCLMETRLFTDVCITHTNKVKEDGTLDINIEVCETKHKNINLGLNYLSNMGWGLALGWENKNLSGIGNRLSLQTDVGQNTYSGALTFISPNFYRRNQEYLAQVRAYQETLPPFDVFAQQCLGRIENQWNQNLFTSAGIKAEVLNVEKSVNDGTFQLLSFPLYMKISFLDSDLNPTAGLSFNYWAVPTIDLKSWQNFYLSQVASFMTYLPLKQRQWILAQKVSLGTLTTANFATVPPVYRFFGGAENNLRGYWYMTVSPTDSQGQLIGGRSFFYYTFESRIKIGDCFGLVPFVDAGCVSSSILPSTQDPFLFSTGLGFRFYSFIGPFKVDFAVPLNKRKQWDADWWVYVSIGETF